MYVGIDISKLTEVVSFNRHKLTTSGFSSGSYSEYFTLNFDRAVSSLSNLLHWHSMTGYNINTDGSFIIMSNIQAIGTTSYQIRLYTSSPCVPLFVSFYFIAIDKNVASKAYRTYISMEHSFYSNGLYLSFFTYNSLADSNRYIVGLTYLQNNQATATTYVGYNVTFDNQGTLKKMDEYQYLYLKFLGIYSTSCGTGYYYNSIDSSCVTQCPSSLPQQDRYCISCISYCTNCLNTSYCAQCSETREMDFTSSTCVCKLGYVQNFTALCISCSSFGYGCLNCTGSSCNLCDINNNFNPNFDSFGSCYCTSNSQYNMTLNTCVCAQKYYNSTGVCYQCHESCLSCQLSSATCTSCYPHMYAYQSGSMCMCENQFKYLCTSSTSSCNASICYLDPSINVQISLNSLTKDTESNTLFFNITISPRIEFFNTLDINQVLDFGLSEGTKIVSYTYQNEIMTLSVAYTDDVHNINTSITLNFNNTGNLSFSQTPIYSYNYTVAPSNNLEAKYYDPNQYTLKIYLLYSSYILLGLSLAVFLIGLYSSKVVVTEMIGVIQVSALGLFMIDVYYPLIDSLYILRYSNGYGDIISRSQYNLPQGINRIGVDQYVCSNLNVMLFIVFIPLITGLIYYCLSKYQRKNKTSNLSKFKLCVGEWMMLTIIFFIYNLSSSTSIFIKYATTGNWKFPLSIVQIAISYLIIIMNGFFYWYSDYNYFGQFKYMFKWLPFELNFYFIHMGIRILIGLLIGAASQSFVAGLVATLMFGTVAVVTIVKKPYADILHSVRSFINVMISSVVFGLYTIIAWNGPSYGRSLQTKIPLIIIVLLYVVVFMAIGFIIRQFLIDKKKALELQDPILLIQDEVKKHEELMRKQIQESMKQGGERSFAKKMFLTKNKKIKKKKFMTESLDVSKIRDEINCNENNNFDSLDLYQNKLNQTGNGHDEEEDNNSKEHNNGEGGGYYNLQQMSLRVKGNNVNSLNNTDNLGLTMSRVLMVDHMLKQGLI